MRRAGAHQGARRPWNKCEQEESFEREMWGDRQALSTLLVRRPRCRPSSLEICQTRRKGVASLLFASIQCIEERIGDEGGHGGPGCPIYAVAQSFDQAGWKCYRDSPPLCERLTRPIQVAFSRRAFVRRGRERNRGVKWWFHTGSLPYGCVSYRIKTRSYFPPGWSCGLTKWVRPVKGRRDLYPSFSRTRPGAEAGTRFPCRRYLQGQAGWAVN
jgi:hypothetical protein